MTVLTESTLRLPDFHHSSNVPMLEKTSQLLVTKNHSISGSALSIVAVSSPPSRVDPHNSLSVCHRILLPECFREASSISSGNDSTSSIVGRRCSIFRPSPSESSGLSGKCQRTFQASILGEGQDKGWMGDFSDRAFVLIAFC